MKPSEETVKLPYIPVNLYKRPDTPYWQYTFKKFSGSGYVRKSTGKTDINDATNVASKEYFKMKAAFDDGVYVEKGRGKLKFSNVCQEVIKYINYLREQNPAKFKPIYDDYIWIINRYFTEEKLWDKSKPHLRRMQSCLVTMDITKITRADLLQFDEERYAFLDRAPSVSTVSQHNGCLSFIFNYAILKMKIMDDIQKPIISKEYTTHREQIPRACFTLREAPELCYNAQMWAMDGIRKKGYIGRTINKKSSREIRRLLYAYIGILLSTGIRTGIETQNLKWCDIKKEYSEKFQSYYHKLSVSGKGKKRTINSFRQIGHYLEVLQRLHPDLENLTDDELFQVNRRVFVRPGKYKQPDLTSQFKKLLIDYDMLYDEHGEERVLYSLRHTALLYLLKEKKWTFEKSAIYLGTSIFVIESFYKKNEYLIEADNEIEPIPGTRVSRQKARAAGYEHVPDDF